MKNLAHACRILNIETPERNLPADETAYLLAQVKRLYHMALKTEHPDKRGENGLGAAHNRTVELGEAYRFVRAFLGKRRFTLTEWFERSRRKRTGRPTGEWNRKAVAQFSRFGRLIQTWPSITEAERDTGIHRSSISNSANGWCGAKSAGGFVWKFVTH